MFFLVLIQERTKKEPKKIKAEKPDPMGSPGAELPRGTTRPACGVAQTVPLGNSRATFRPRPICGSGFYAVFIIPATFIVSSLYEHSGECLSPVGAEDKDKG